MIEACSYLRVSSTGQLSGDGFPRQREAISKFAAANGYELIAEFSDDISGKTELDNRPGLAACMERIENNGVKVVIANPLRDSRETRWSQSSSSASSRRSAGPCSPLPG
jgi:DNA invertase Pin-like site-specific DNA recombinase